MFKRMESMQPWLMSLRWDAIGAMAGIAGVVVALIGLRYSRLAQRPERAVDRVDDRWEHSRFAQPVDAKYSVARPRMRRFGPFGGLILLVVGYCGFLVWAYSDDIGAARVGECVTDRPERVPCDDDLARFQLVQIIDRETEPPRAEEPCGSNSWYWADQYDSFWDYIIADQAVYCVKPID